MKKLSLVLVVLALASCGGSVESPDFERAGTFISVSGKMKPGAKANRDQLSSNVGLAIQLLEKK